MKAGLLIFASLLILNICCSAQSALLPAKILFSFDHDELDVAHYEFTVDTSGKASYQSRTRPDPATGQSESLNREFNISPGTCKRIFQLARDANFFHGSFDYTEHKIAFSGTKTFTYDDGIRRESTSFNWSENKSITELFDIFQAVSTTLEEEPVLRRLDRFDKLGLNAELAQMERKATGGWMKELILISDALQVISKDPSVMAIARRRADHLLQLARSGT